MWSTFRLRIQHPAQPVSELPVRLNSKDRVGPKLDSGTAPWASAAGEADEPRRDGATTFDDAGWCRPLEAIK